MLKFNTRNVYSGSLVLLAVFWETVDTVDLAVFCGNKHKNKLN